MTVPTSTPLVVGEWSRRIVAEYASAAYATDYAGLLLRSGASPDLVESSLSVAQDELRHARRSSEVYALAGGTQLPAVDPARLSLPSGPQALHDLVAATVRVFCFSETVAVRLFGVLRSAAAVPLVVDVLEEIQRDEPRHAALGWTALDWLLDSPHEPFTRAVLNAEADRWLDALQATYCSGGGGDSPVSADDRRWGIVAADEYRRAVNTAISDDIAPRLRRRGICLPEAIDHRSDSGRTDHAAG